MELSSVSVVDLLKEVDRRGAQCVKSALLNNLHLALTYQREGYIRYTSKGEPVKAPPTPTELVALQKVIEQCQDYFMAATASPQEIAAKAFEEGLKYNGVPIGTLPEMEGKDAATG